MRLFTGLAVPSDTAKALTEMVELLRPIAGLKWSPPEKLHVTTAFIGEWPEAAIPDLVSSLSGVRAEPSIEIVLRGLGWMPNPRHPRALYAGVEPTSPLAALAAGTARVLTAAGVSLEERAYHPHVTLARLKGDPLKGQLQTTVPLVAETFASSPCSFTVQSFYLYLSAEGKYTKLKEFSFVPS